MVEGLTKMLQSFVAKENNSNVILRWKVGGDWEAGAQAIKLIFIVEQICNVLVNNPAQNLG